MQFFSERVACAMESYKNKNQELCDCEGIVKLVRRVNALIKAMSSRTPQNAPRYDSCKARVRRRFMKLMIQNIRLFHAPKA